MRIVVLVKPVPDPASAGERLGPDGRLDRAAAPAVVNGNDEYVLEAALKLIEAAGEGSEVTLLSMAPATAPETLRKALAMGATRGVLVTDPALAGSDAAVDGTRPGGRAPDPRVRPRPRRRRHVRRRRRHGGRGRRRAPAAAVPLVRRADRTRRGGRDRPRPPHQPDRLRPARGADAGPDLVHAGARRAALPVAQGDHGCALEGDRRRRSLADLGLDAADGRWRGGRDDAVLETRTPPPRGATEVVRGTPADGAARIVELLAERRII